MPETEVSNGLLAPFNKDLKNAASNISAQSRFIPTCRPAGLSVVMEATARVTGTSWKTIRP